MNTNDEWIATTAQKLDQIGLFTEQHLHQFTRQITYRTISKNTVLLAEGTVCQTVYCNVAGAFFQSVQNDEGESSILDLHLPGDWFFNHQSFTTQTPSASTIQAYTDGTVLELSIGAIHELIATSPAFLQLGSLLNQATDRIRFFDQNLTPDQRYQYVLNARPQLLHLFPLKMIASYLKIKPETLSRVRERVARSGS